MAEAAGAPHRALLDLDGTPMLERVLRVLYDSPRIGSIVVSMDRTELARGCEGIAQLEKEGAVRFIDSEDSPSRSVLSGLRALGDAPGALVTTADHALLDHTILHHFLDAAETLDASVVAGMVAEATIRQRFPEAKRTYLRLRGNAYSGANLFRFALPEGLRAVEFWRRVEAHRKRPWRFVLEFGPTTLLLFALRRLDLEAAFERASRAIGVTARAVELPYAEAAVDVDKLDDLRLVEAVLRERRSR